MSVLFVESNAFFLAEKERMLTTTTTKLLASSIITHTNSMLSHHMGIYNLFGGLEDLAQIAMQGQFIRPFN
jgi:hypothetical protein